ncbi:MAG TPA: dienelactone hydrolase family protein [Ottowia sp.]|jgi:carboxymethylenebutenolidase|nr:MAG: carboxymethylenebutenolidase [Burkholderiales bacterium 68-10]HOM20396.1 dienelactone hydrolase family protein [Ottowia sp.]HON29959.1 dienelactone hydrolase family protein [Ottowia sp.]HQX66887.1 dienelactone hydrolase family protein [Ottowia sp.]HQZ56582.1 dienelactone hydrolase family protein [Ottowia sp.]
MLKTDHLNDAQALLDQRGGGVAPSRRRALTLGLGMGYAAATLPVMAQTAIKTPADGLSVGEVSIDVAGFKMPAFRAQPAGKTGLPVVLVLSEIFGVHEYIADTAVRLARAGYLAIAPELFVRQGDAQSYGELAKLMSEVIAKVPDAQVMGDLDAAVAWAAANGGDTGKLAVTGFCWGGRQTWLYAAHQPKVKAGVAWYGRLVGDSTALTPRHPLDVAAQLKAPVLGLYGGADTGIALDTVERMKAALAAAGAQGNAAAGASQFVVYPDAPHAFHADYRPSFRKDAAEDGWKRALAWLRQHGVA